MLGSDPGIYSRAADEVKEAILTFFAVF